MPGNNSDIIIIIVSVAIVFLILLVFIFSFLFIYKNKQARNEAELKNITEKYQQEILKAQLETQEQTLSNISQEIHDNFGQVLSLVVLNLSAVDFKEADAGEQRVHKSIDLVKKVITDLRNLSKMLDSENLKAGLADVLQNELEMLDKTGRYHTSFNKQGEEIVLDHSRQIIAYRIVQESLNNIIKHAHANKIGIDINFKKQMIVIAVTDNGKGFKMDEIKTHGLKKNGAGLNNMMKRAKLIQAELEILSDPASGTKIVLSIPQKGL